MKSANRRQEVRGVNVSGLNLSWIKPGMAARLVWQEDGEGRSLEGVLGDCFTDRLVLWVPEVSAETSLPPVRASATLRIPLDHGLYVVPSAVATTPVVYSLGMAVTLTLAGEPERWQRRQFRRVRVTLPPIAAQRLTPGEPGAAPLQLEVVNLSGGGMLFRSSAPLAPGDRLRFALPLEGQEPVAVTLTVIAEAGEGHYRGYFSGLSEADVQRIVRYVFAREIEERKRLPRLAVGIPVHAMAAHLLDLDGHRLRSFPLFLTAIRDDGLHFAAPEQLYPGDRLEVELDFGEHHQFRAIITVLASLDDPLTAALGHRTGRLHYRGRFTVIDEREQRWIQERLALQARTPAS
ncbi:MAG: PilZ domain-containing protein [Chloroflexi bacterium]|nr:PilZ domain-containing protein [Chloroflexota bacterium]